MSAPPLLTQIFEAYPSPTFLVDGDVVVQLANRAARELAEVPEGESVPQKRGGDLLRCIHSEDHADGCGRSEACQGCVVRGSVAAALLSGAVERQQATMELRDASGERFDLHVLVSASPIEVEDTRLAVLTVEDVSEIVRRGREQAAPALAFDPSGSIEASLGAAADTYGAVEASNGEAARASGEDEASSGDAASASADGEPSHGDEETSFGDVGASLRSEA